MHRLPQAARTTAVIVVLLAVLLAPAVVEARGPLVPVPQPSAGRPWTADAVELARTAPQAIKHGTTQKSCTGWRSTYQPPDTIRVLRTRGPDTGNVEVVDYRTYVAWVTSVEWTNHYPLEALKVGAIAVKQYGWYYTIVYRGGVDALGNCYDVVDNTNDQYYDPDATPARPLPGKVALQAIAATWNVSLRKWSQKDGTSHLFLTGYRSGKNVACGQERDGYRLYQHSIYYCASPAVPKFAGSPHDLNFEQIVRLYLAPNLEVVSPGAHDVIGNVAGDITALTAVDGTSLTPRIYQVARSAGVTPAASSAVSVASMGLLATTSADMNGDGRDDLVMLAATSETSVRIDVALSDGTADYQPITTWLPASDLGVPVANARLFGGDYNADGRADVGILVPAPPVSTPAGTPVPDPQAQLLVVLQRKKTGAAGTPTAWWTGSLDLAQPTDTWAGDLNGDGATDLLVAQAAVAPAAGVHFAAALSAPPTPSSALPGTQLGALATWFDAPDLSVGGLLGTIGDLNRDGFDDLFVAFATPAGTRIDVIKASSRRVRRVTLWTATAADPVPLAKLKLQSADVNLDGRADLVLYRNREADGTTLLVLRATYKKLKPYATFTDATLNWSTATPY